jgi:two-component system response regulator YesN
MYKIFIVEDEQLIRQNIKNIIESIKGPYVIAGEASDGEMALQMMQDTMPDILITDLRMPFLDGFGLISHIKTIIPWLKIIIISGYDEFESARKGISLGVDMYLLKPVRRAELEDAISKVVKSIDENRRETPLIGGFDEERRQYALKQHFISLLLYGSERTAFLLECARNLDLDIVHSFYQISMFYFDIDIEKREEFKARIFDILDDQTIEYFYFNGSDLLTVILYEDDKYLLFDKTYEFMDLLKLNFEPQISVISKSGEVVERLSLLSNSCAKVGSMIKELIVKGAKENLPETLEESESSFDIQPKYSQIINQAKAYLNSNFSDPDISLISTAKFVGMSPAHFSTIFAKVTGKSFINYLTALRVNRAKELLKNSDTKLSSIAMDIGYNEPNYFSHVFKKIEGITPKEYRNKFI